MDHDSLWIKLGSLLRTEQRYEGNKPTRTAIVRFVCEHGFAEYNGKYWIWEIQQ